MVRVATRFVLLVGALLVAPNPAAGQYGFLGSLANRFSDLSFFANVGGLSPEHDRVRSDGMKSFGLEILFEVATLRREVGPAPVPDDSVRIVWREMRVERTAEGVDTINIYDIEQVSASVPLVDVWTFELGLGYGQASGFEAREPSIELKGAVRSLPAVSLYASYDAWGTYFGLRSGLMEVSGLQVVAEDGSATAGSAQSFMAGLLLGQAWAVAGMNLFIEGAYLVRDFPSVEWNGTPPPGTPRSMNLSGWALGAGVQFGVGG